MEKICPCGNNAFYDNLCVILKCRSQNLLANWKTKNPPECNIRPPVPRRVEWILGTPLKGHLCVFSTHYCQLRIKDSEIMHYPKCSEDRSGHGSKISIRKLGQADTPTNPPTHRRTDRSGNRGTRTVLVSNTNGLPIDE